MMQPRAGIKKKLGRTHDGSGSGMKFFKNYFNMEPRLNVTCEISTMQALLWYLMDTGNRWNTVAEVAYFYATYILHQRL